VTAAETLTLALHELVDTGQRTPCFDDDAWISDDPDDRAEAARRCLACPVLDPCALAAHEIRPRLVFGVWAGHDFESKRKANAA
jgi:hypothetical protein